MLKLSILVFCYNQEKTISQTLESILTQNHGYQYELIVCDDCSQDNTSEIIKDYYKRYPQIIKLIIRSHNLGLIKNYYDGMSHAQGEYVMVCAGDDYWLPGKIQIQIKYMENNLSCGMVYTDSIIVDCENKVIGNKCINRKPNFKNLIRKDHIIAGTICMRNLLFKRYILEVDPIMYNWVMEDYPFILWCSINSNIHHIPIKLFAYRKSNNSITRPANPMKLLSFYNSELDVRNYYLKDASQKFKDIILKDYIKRLIEIYHMTKKNDVKDYINEKLLLIRKCKSFKINCQLRIRYIRYYKLYYYSSRLKLKLITIAQGIIPNINY